MLLWFSEFDSESNDPCNIICIFHVISIHTVSVIIINEEQINGDNKGSTKWH